MSSNQILLLLQQAVNQDPFLRCANFEPYQLSKSLAYHENNVQATLKALKNYATWHKETLGHQRKRVSIVHVHAFLLANVSTFLPLNKAVDQLGNPIEIFRFNKDFGIIPKHHYANLIMFTKDYHLRHRSNSEHSLFIEFEGTKFKNFRPSKYRLIGEASACALTPAKESTLYAFNTSKTALKLWGAVVKLAKHIPYKDIHFIKREELVQYMIDQIPTDFGGNRSMEEVQADMEEFIRSEYTREGLRYEPIDVKSIDWKTYKVPDVDFSIRPESAMSVASNIDFDEIDARIEALGLGSEE
ncbi:UNVERIFIED_CONTAM: hypothetical protein HDU68_007356 [Siphonaria sp. JEL0065]|nr:hypothetical protein HDU68_007356 [Siphonaria sp. JEL0065]